MNEMTEFLSHPHLLKMILLVLAFYLAFTDTLAEWPPISRVSYAVMFCASALSTCISADSKVHETYRTLDFLSFNFVMFALAMHLTHFASRLSGKVFDDDGSIV